MTFSLKLYLNESILSNILFNEILNEPGGFFKYLICQPDDNYISSHASIDLFSKTKMERILFVQTMLNRIISMFTIPSAFERNDTINVNNYQHTEGFDSYKIEQLHKQYLKYFNLFIKYFKNLFKKPEVLLFSELVSSNHYFDLTIDLQNITDFNFKKYTFQDIKDNNDYFMDTVSKKCIFWFNKDKKFLGFTKSGVIKIIAKNHITDSMCFNADNTTDDIMFRIKTKNVVNYDDKVLEFPYTRYQGLHDGFIDSYIFRKPNQKTYKKMGNPISSVSNVRKLLGIDKNSYCYVFTPNVMDYNDEVGNIVGKSGSSLYPDNVGFGFNEVIHKSLKKQKQHADYLASKQYKWSYDIYGKLIPYFSGPHTYLSLIDENGKLVTTIDHALEHKYYDNICNFIKEQNQKRYEKLVTIIRARKDIVGEYEPRIRDIEQSIIDTNKFVIDFNDAFRDKFKESSHKEQERLTTYVTNFSFYIVKTANNLACEGFKCLETYNELLNAIEGKNKQGKTTTISSYDIRNIRDHLGLSITRFDGLLKEYNDKKNEMTNYLNNDQ